MHHSLLSIFRIAFDEKTRRERERGARAASLTISRAVYEDDSRRCRHERRERSENDAAIIRNKDARQRRRMRGNATPRRGCKLREGIPRTATLPRFARGETQEDRAPQWPRERRASAN